MSTERTKPAPSSSEDDGLAADLGLQELDVFETLLLEECPELLLVLADTPKALVNKLIKGQQRYQKRVGVEVAWRCRQLDHGPDIGALLPEALQHTGSVAQQGCDEEVDLIGCLRDAGSGNPTSAPIGSKMLAHGLVRHRDTRRGVHQNEARARSVPNVHPIRARRDDHSDRCGGLLAEDLDGSIGARVQHLHFHGHLPGQLLGNLGCDYEVRLREIHAGDRGFVEKLLSVRSEEDEVDLFVDILWSQLLAICQDRVEEQLLPVHFQQERTPPAAQGLDLHAAEGRGDVAGRLRERGEGSLALGREQGSRRPACANGAPKCKRSCLRLALPSEHWRRAGRRKTPTRHRDDRQHQSRKGSNRNQHHADSPVPC
mmetsp:Transcript_104740/g.265999  ORF Transcript_104740/g.265999 Transcript_104740/m.265999 type:complete len:372 (-) Transcript_104740:132-1247(-)